MVPLHDYLVEYEYDDDDYAYIRSGEGFEQVNIIDIIGQKNVQKPFAFFNYPHPKESWTWQEAMQYLQDRTIPERLQILHPSLVSTRTMVVNPVELPRLEGWARDALHRFLQKWKEYCQKCAVSSQNAVGLATLLTEQQLDTLAKMTDMSVGSITNKDVEEFIKEHLETGPSDAALTWLHITNKSGNLRIKKDWTGPVMEWFEDLRKRLSLNGIKDDFFEDNPKMAKKRNDIAVSRIMMKKLEPM